MIPKWWRDVNLIQVHNILVSNQTWFLYHASLITHDLSHLITYVANSSVVTLQNFMLDTLIPDTPKTYTIHESMRQQGNKYKIKWASGQSCLVTFPSSHALQYSSRRSPTSGVFCKSFWFFIWQLPPFFLLGFFRGTIKFHQISWQIPSPARPPLPLCTSQWQSPCVLCQIALHLVGSQPLKRQLTLKTPRIMPTTPNGRSHTNNLPGHLPPMELRPPSAKRSHTQNASPWNSGQNSKMIQTPKLRDIQNTMEHKSHPPRTRYPFYNNSNGIAS